MKSRLFSFVIMLAVAVVAVAESPKYIFYFIGDGMGYGQVNTTQTYLRDVYSADSVLTMLQLPVAGVVLTYSASNPITDSTAAGTALATGVKTKNGMIGLTPDSVAVSSIAEQLKVKGYGVGIITSVAPDDATPGAFYANVPSRNNYYEIGVQAAESGFEFMAGAELRGLKRKGVPTDLMDVMKRSGVEVVYGLDKFAETTSNRVILLATNRPHDNGIGYAIDSVAGAMKLDRMVETGISHLMKHTPDRFFMMVEGGEIDHAGHANDGATIVRDVIAFDESLRVAMDFYRQHPDETLILVTADHETGGFAIGNTPHGYTADLKYLDYQRISKDRFSDNIKALLKTKREFRWEDMRQYLSDMFGFWRTVPVTEEETARLMEKFDRTFRLRNSEDQKTMYNNFNEFAVEVFQVMDTHTGLGWTTVHHTANPVPVFAIGCGAELFGGVNDNIDLPQKIRRLTGIE